MKKVKVIRPWEREDLSVKHLIKLRRKLMAEFSWESTPQGYVYWSKVSDNLTDLIELAKEQKRFKNDGA